MKIKMNLGEFRRVARLAAPVTFASAEDPDFLAVLMPMRV